MNNQYLLSVLLFSVTTSISASAYEYYYKIEDKGVMIISISEEGLLNTIGNLSSIGVLTGIGMIIAGAVASNDRTSFKLLGCGTGICVISCSGRLLVEAANAELKYKIIQQGLTKFKSMDEKKLLNKAEQYAKIEQYVKDTANQKK